MRMLEKLKEIVAQAYCGRCQYNTEESIKDNIWVLLDAYKINVTFFVCITGVEFTESIYNHCMSGQIPEHVRDEVYFIAY